MVKRIHRLTHANANEMKYLLNDSKLFTPELGKSCNIVFQVCNICTSSGEPVHCRKVSLTHVHESFNESIQADFLVAYIKG